MFEFVYQHVCVQEVAVLLYLWVWGRFGFGFHSGCFGFELFAQVPWGRVGGLIGQDWSGPDLLLRQLQVLILNISEE